MLFVVIMICAASEPRCDASHARAYRAFVMPEGFAICSAPAVFGDMANSPAGPKDDEVQHTRCEWHPK